MQILFPEGIPLLSLLRCGDMQLPVNTNALLATQRAEEGVRVLASTLKLPASQTCEGAITHFVRSRRMA